MRPQDKGQKSANATEQKAAKAPLTRAPITPPPQPAGAVPPLFRRVDWLTFAITTLLVFIGYWWTLAPDMTCEDSGELAVASMYAGVPHPPGYPVWTIYTWAFTKLPVSNIAYRVGLSSAVAAALACGLVGLMVSRGSSMMMEGIRELKDIVRKWENPICLVSGFVAAMLIGFNGFMWSQAVIVEVYTLSVLSLAGVLVCLMRWVYAPHQHRYLYLAFFWFGICFNNHQSLLVVALGLEAAILAVQPRLGRDLVFWNSLVYLGGLVGLKLGLISVLEGNTPLLVIYNLIGLSSIVAWVYLTFKTGKRGIEMARDVAFVCAVGYLLALFGHITNYVGFFEYKRGMFFLFNIAGIAAIGAFIYLVLQTRNFGKEWLAALFSGGAWALGASFYLYMPLTSMTNPPMNWGYPRTVFGFFHAFTRGQYEKINPTTSMWKFIQQIWMYIVGVVEEFNLVYVLIAIIPFLFWKRMEKRERSWLVGLSAIYVTLSLFLLILLNPAPDLQSRHLNKVFFTSSHVFVAMLIGYGLTLIAATLITQYQKYRRWVLLGGLVTIGVAIINLVVAFVNFRNPLVHYTAIAALLTVAGITGVVWFNRLQAPLRALLGLFACIPIWTIMAHWEDNEQRGHLFGYWFGHDMFTPPFNSEKDGKPIYPEMPRDTILFGGTDPGRFNPTYMIFCESFIPPEKKPKDPKFDRRDVYLITQNALADPPYLNYIRAHYNRSAQADPLFFSELLRGAEERQQNIETNFFARLMLPIDNYFTDLGDRIEKKRRTSSSLFNEADFLNLKGLTDKLRPGPQQDRVSAFVYTRLSKETQELITRGAAEGQVRPALARDLNAMLEKIYEARQQLQRKGQAVMNTISDPGERDKVIGPIAAEYRNQHQLYSTERFAQVNLSERTKRFVQENPGGHTLIRLNRILLEETYPGLIAASIGGLYPDLEIHTPSADDHARCFNEYMTDVQRRMAANQLKPGEDVSVEGGRVSVRGQTSVMNINALLTKVIFDKNPHHEFYIEESFPLDWMYPYLTPYGIIMKINRNPVPEFAQELLDRDHEFWSKYSQRAIGNWIKYETTVSNICAFVEKTYLRRDYKGFEGDPKFVRDSDGQKAFSKLRSSIAGVYAWRVQKLVGDTQQALKENRAEDYQRLNQEYQRVTREAEFAMKQAFAFCPYSPEATFRYMQLLLTMGRFDEAKLIAETSLKFDKHNQVLKGAIQDLDRYRAAAAPRS